MNAFFFAFILSSRSFSAILASAASFPLSFSRFLYFSLFSIFLSHFLSFSLPLPWVSLSLSLSLRPSIFYFRLSLSSFPPGSRSLTGQSVLLPSASLPAATQMLRRCVTNFRFSATRVVPMTGPDLMAKSISETTVEMFFSCSPTLKNEGKNLNIFWRRNYLHSTSES